MQKQNRYRVCVTVPAAVAYQHYTEHYTLTSALRHIRVLVQSGEVGPVVLVTLPDYYSENDSYLQGM